MADTRRPVSNLRRPAPIADREAELADAKEARNYLSEWFSNLVSVQAETVSACLSALSSPLLSGSERDRAVEPGMVAAANDTTSSEVGGGGGGLLRKIGVGILAAAYVGMILTILLVVAAVLGVAVVRMWVEEPVLLRERLNFDYTDAHPKAIFSFVHGSGGEFKTHNTKFVAKSKKMGVPVGHTFYVSLLLVMPESDYNRELGIFQVAAELISNNGGIVRRSSHPCMLQFRSQPIRLMRELIWGVPLLLGIASETQRIVIPTISHKEGYPRTEAIRVILMPRASTLALPAVYEAEIVLKSHLPWMKELLYRWKWTFYVWVSMYIYMALLVVSLCCFRSLMVPVLTTTVRGYDEERLMLEPSEDRVGEERNVPESLKRRRLSSRRKAMLRQKVMAEPAETVDSSASSYTITRDDTAPLQEDTEDSESVCFRSGGEE
ncbi:PREDICTED: seipin-1 [Ipomoea nil]|uniref:seipin-1 n=1 Tax=Ipomoea nil TaxID=35883 RepID=UPI0009013453|nr:PREDICTED: seipin-1 [Ipomoea nil]